MKTQHKLPKQLFTTKQVRDILRISQEALVKLDPILKPVIISKRGDRRYDSDIVGDFIDKGGVK